MNNYHSNPESFYKNRWIASHIKAAIEEHPVIVLTGARQVGKSTLLMNEEPFHPWKYISFDDFDMLSLAENEPNALWMGSDRVILDEVQKVPRTLLAIKQAVDKERGRRKFILSGSANLLLMEKIGESLAGRAVYFQLYPMTLGEMMGNPVPDIISGLFKGKYLFKRDLVSPLELYNIMLRGFMPPLLTLKTREGCLRWWEGYVATYLERDLRQLSQIESLSDFRRVMTALALRSGQLLNQTEIARDTGVSQPSVYRYLNLLETTCLLKRVPAYANSRTKRLIKSPKAYFIDPGLACYLMGYYHIDTLKSARECGNIFETMVFLHISVLCELMIPSAKIYYWRTVAGKEVDFVIEQGRKLIAIEVKLTQSPKYQDAERLRIFLEEYPETVAGILIHSGNEMRYLGDKIMAVPWKEITG